MTSGKLNIEIDFNISEHLVEARKSVADSDKSL